MLQSNSIAEIKILLFFLVQSSFLYKLYTPNRVQKLVWQRLLYTIRRAANISLAKQLFMRSRINQGSIAPSSSKISFWTHSAIVTCYYRY